MSSTAETFSLDPSIKFMGTSPTAVMENHRTLTASSSKARPDRSSKPSASVAPAGAGLTTRLILVGLVVLLIAGGVLFVRVMLHRGPAVDQSPSSRPIPDRYDGDRAMGYLKKLCEFGPRPSGSDAMIRQQRYLESFFRERGAEVTRQDFETRNPNDGSAMTMTNLIASWHPDRPIRFLFCAHYDTRPYPDRDRQNPKGTFIGANDGASGTAGLMELSNQLDDLPDDIGIDMVLFDGEEFVWVENRDRYFLGSTFYAQTYRQSPPQVPFRAGVLFDMIGDKELKLYYEMNSIRYAKPVAQSFWQVAKRLRVDAFVPKTRHDLRDDHLPLNQIAKIPTIDVIDFDYPRPGIGSPSYWHTENDIPENCSGESIAAVVWVAHQWVLAQSRSKRNTSR
ncbi:M28 family peptidase [Roseiconus lacunae]|uniref:M28 family peptidase n=1 Tax=Roseiconus lacunae TaxID=2605694 RepID=UPI0030908A12|nr:M28 family peptidase [Stieleria sp. HD01]